MSEDRRKHDHEVAVQREVARVALASLPGFALAGSGAIREHGITERPTEDIDLFTTSQDVTAFGLAVDQVTEQLRASGMEVQQSRRAAQFARLHVVGRDGTELDAIRASGRFSDDELLTAAAERDVGFEVRMFARQLTAASRLQPAQVDRYGVTAEQLDAVKSRCARWAADLQGRSNDGTVPP